MWSMCTDFWQCKSPFPSLWHQQSAPTCLSGFGLRGQICAFSCLLISIHLSMIYSGALCVAELFASIRGCVPTVSLIYSTASLQSNKRMSVGDLTSTNIPIIILLKHPISVCNPSRPQRHSGPTAHKNHSRSTLRKRRQEQGDQREQRRHGNSLLCCSSLSARQRATEHLFYNS